MQGLLAMSRWFRFYSDAMRHPKVAKLTDAQFRLWVELLAVASERDGLIPCLDDLRHVLKRRLDHLSRGLDDLIRASLIEVLGDGYIPHGWSKRQYKSDTSTDRVRKHRENGNVSVTPPDTDTDTDTDKKIPTVSPQTVVDHWNAMASQNALSKVAKLTDKRRRSCQARLKDDGLEAIQRAIAKIPQSDFLCGRTGDWSADFDFLMQPDSVTKILEGKYDARNGNSVGIRPTQRLGAGRETGSVTERAMQRAAERLGVEGPGFGSQGGASNAIPSDDRAGSLPHASRSIRHDGGRQSQLAYGGGDGGS